MSNFIQRANAGMGNMIRLTNKENDKDYKKFIETVEDEKVVNYIESLTVRELFELMIEELDDDFMDKTVKQFFEDLSDAESLSEMFKELKE